MQRVAVYARVSTKGQKLDRQLDELKSYCERREFKKVIAFKEKRSGADKDRPQLNAMLDQCRKGKIDIVIVQALDRLGRDLGQLVAMIDEFGKLGVEFISITDGFDTSTPMGKLFFAINAAYAEFGRNVLSERVKSGMAAAKRRGRHVGRPATSINKVEQARALRADGMSFRKIADIVNVSPATVVNYCAK